MSRSQRKASKLTNPLWPITTSLEATGRAVEAARLTVASDAVVYDEVATVDVDL